jgi:hypothetical protein
MKYNAIVDSGIPILKRYDIPDHLIPPVSQLYFHPGSYLERGPMIAKTTGLEPWIGKGLMDRTRKLRSTRRSLLGISAERRMLNRKIYILLSGEHGKIWSTRARLRRRESESWVVSGP